ECGSISASDSRRPENRGRAESRALRSQASRPRESRITRHLSLDGEAVNRFDDLALRPAERPMGPRSAIVLRQAFAVGESGLQIAKPRVAGSPVDFDRPVSRLRRDSVKIGDGLLVAAETAQHDTA